MKLTYRLYLLVACLCLCGQLRAQESRSDRLLLRGNDAKKTWWTVVKLKHIPKAELGPYNDIATFRIFLSELFNDKPIIVDERVIEQGHKVYIEIPSGENRIVTIERVMHELFARQHVQFNIELPLEYAFVDNACYFVETPKIIKIAPREVNLDLLNCWHEGVSKNLDFILGRKSPPPVKPMTGDEIASSIQRMLAEHVDDIKVHYSSELNTLHFSMPITSEKNFDEVCWNILSNIH